MKVFSVFLVLSTLLSSCQAYEANSIGPNEPRGVIELEQTEIYKLNAYADLPSNGNALKVHDVCYDESIAQGYAIGILTPDLAVFKDDKTLDFVDTGVGNKGEFLLKHILCGEGQLIVISDEEFQQIDPYSHELLKEFTFPKKERIYSAHAVLDAEKNRIVVGSQDNKTLNIYDSKNFEKLGGISSEKADYFFTPEGNILVFETRGINENTVFIYDGKSLEKIESYSLSLKGKILDSAYDSANQALWILSKNEVSKVSFKKETSSALTLPVAPDTKRILAGGGFLIAVSENGFGSDEMGFLGGVTIIDTKKNEVKGTVEIPYKHNDVELDLENKIAYIVDAGGNSITKLDLQSGDFKRIDVGNSLEDGVLTEQGHLLLTNRLGGSTIFDFDPESEEMEIIEAKIWPVGIAYSTNLDRTFSFSSAESQIEVIQDGEIVDRFELNVPASNTDAIGHMVMDKTRDVLYVVIPEQSRILALNAKTGDLIKDIPLEAYKQGKSDTEIGGPATVVAGIYEPTSTLLVYIRERNQFYVYDGLQNYELIKEFDGPSGDSEFVYALFVDQNHHRFYYKGSIYDAKSLEKISDLAYGDAVVGVDEESGVLFTAGTNKSKQEILYALSTEGELLDQINLNQNQYISGRFIYDPDEGKIYVLYSDTVELWAYSLYKSME